MDTTDILIAGAGVPGLTLALLLAQAGLAVTVIDPADRPPVKSGDTRTSALMQGSIRLLERAGAWEQCREAGGVMETLTIIDDAEPPLEAEFHASEIGLDYFGVNMPQMALLTALQARAAAVKGLTVRNGVRLLTFAADEFGITARCDGAQDIRAKLIVGADGRHSAVRESAGIGVREHEYGQRALTCIIRHSRAHDATSTEFHRPSGPFTLVPLPGKNSSVVWVDGEEEIMAMLRLDKASFRQALQDRTNGVLGEVEIAVPPQSWGLKSLRAEKLIAPRAALVAEAAHVLHPLGAQGLNLSLRDVAALAECIIAAARLGLDPGSVAILRRYEAARRQDIDLRVAGTHGLNRFVSTDSPVLKRLRRLGFRSVANTGILRLAAMRNGIAA